MILASYCYRLRISKVIYGICKSKKGSAIIILRSLFAEAGGFEPPVRLPVRQFSKLVVSATHPNFQS